MKDVQINTVVLKYEKEIERLKKKITNLETRNQQLQSQLFEANKNKNHMAEIESLNRTLSEEDKYKNTRIKNLEKEVLDTIKTKLDENSELRQKLENEIIFYKGLHETGSAKIEAAEALITLNETQHKRILSLEKEVEEIKKQNKLQVEQLKLDHERHYLKLKKQLMDDVKSAQYKMSKSNADNLELNTKFGILYKNQMLNELEHQSLQIEDLLRSKEKQDKIIYALRQELKTHELVEQIITDKNVKYLNFAKKCSKNPSDKDDQDNKNINSLNSHENCLTDRNKYNNYRFRIMKKKEYHDYKSLEKVYKEILEENKNMKNKLDTFKDKERINQSRYKGIINLYKEALDDLVKDEEIKKKENIYINIEEINKGNFKFFTKEEKYSILIMLINHLLPLITFKQEDQVLMTLKGEINGIEYKMNNTQMTRFSSNSRNQTLYKPFLGNEPNNFLKINTTNDDSQPKTSSHKKYISIFDNKNNFTQSQLVPVLPQVKVEDNFSQKLRINPQNKSRAQSQTKTKTKTITQKYKSFSVNNRNNKMFNKEKLKECCGPLVRMMFIKNKEKDIETNTINLKQNTINSAHSS